LDEHQELFEIEKDVSPRDKLYFQAWRKWTSSTSGVNTITIYSGSANSKFQFNLPSGESRKIRYIVPPTHAEFLKIISDANSTLKFRRGNSEKLENATGRNFREMSHYIQVWNSNLETYLVKTKENMEMRLRKFIRETTNEDLKQFLENLDELFGFGFYSTHASFPGPFYDKGLIYEEIMEDSSIVIKFLNDPAKEVLLKYYLEKVEMKKISSFGDAAEQGRNLERYCIKRELSGLTSIEVSQSGSPHFPNVKLWYQASVHTFLEKLRIGDGRRYYAKTTLFEPKEKFPFMDYIIFCPDTNKIIFKQVTMSKITVHLNNPIGKKVIIEKKGKEGKEEPKHSSKGFDAVKLKFPTLNENMNATVGELIKFLCLMEYKWDFDEKSGSGQQRFLSDDDKKKGIEGKSLCHLILELIFGEIKNYNVKFQDGMLNVFDGDERFDMEIVYITGTTRDENEKLLETLPIKNILCCYREDLEKLGIPF
jgi:hypothetical protein